MPGLVAAVLGARPLLAFAAVYGLASPVVLLASLAILLASPAVLLARPAIRPSPGAPGGRGRRFPADQAWKPGPASAVRCLC